MEAENHSKNLNGNEALEKIKELGEKVRTCFFSTRIQNPKLSTRPMSTLKVDDDGTLWFMSHKDSNKNQQLDGQKHVDLLFADPAGSHYMALIGEARISTDRAKIKELWSPLLKIWFDGPEDPAITLIRVKPTDGFYWDIKTNKMIQMVKMLAGMVTGKELDDSIEGKLGIKN